MKLYGEEKSDEEIIKFVKDYAAKIKSNKFDRYRAILSLVPAGRKYILDYGCGWGVYSVAMRDKGNIIESIDISQNEIDICKLVWGSQDNLTFENKTIDKFAAETFDVVLSNQVVEHVHNVGSYLSEINRVLKHNGQLIISLPNIMNPRFFFSLLHPNLEAKLKQFSNYYLEKYNKTHDHINAWDPGHFVILCASAGFLLERYIPTEGIAFPVKKIFPSYIFTNNRFLQNFSYTMVFSFRKVKTVKININE